MNHKPSSEKQIIRVPDAQSVAEYGYRILCEYGSEAIEKRGYFTMAISGGSTPVLFFRQIAEESQSNGIDWNKVHIFWVDERAVPPDDEASNYRLAAEGFLNQICIPPGNIYRMPGELDDLGQAAKTYEQTLQRVFGLSGKEFPEFDLIVLGMGSDGHIASLMPGSYALINKENLVTTVFRMEKDFSRLTLTVPVLLAARQLMVLVSGDSKADIVKAVLTSAPDAVKYPAHLLWPVLDKVLWVLDESAARKLQG